MTQIAIHQPNYIPWLGYFHKIFRADIFVFLDNVQFTKGGFTNRVKVLTPDGGKWLSVPVKVSLGDPIDAVQPTTPDWASRHVDALCNYYKGAACFKAVWPEVRELVLSVPQADLAAVNMHLVQAMTVRLGFSCSFKKSSDLILGAASDDRLVEIVSLLAPGGTYLSGKGGAKYQDPAKFEAAGLGFAYLNYAPAQYPQGREDFVAGLSILDAVFHLGFEGAAAIAAGSAL